MKTKICIKCREEKELSAFHKDISKKSGLRSSCKSCVSDCFKEYYSNNKEKVSLKQKTYYKANREKVVKVAKRYRASHKEKRATYIKAYKAANKEKITEREKSYYETNRCRFLAQSKKHYEENKEYYFNKRAIRNRLVGGQLIAKRYKKELAEIYKNRPEGHHVDHTIPLRGNGVCGLHVPWNLQYLPSHENLSKGVRYES